jgi:hypothetical protein
VKLDGAGGAILPIAGRQAKTPNPPCPTTTIANEETFEH